MKVTLSIKVVVTKHQLLKKNAQREESRKERSEEQLGKYSFKKAREGENLKRAQVEQTDRPPRVHGSWNVEATVNCHEALSVEGWQKPGRKGPRSDWQRGGSACALPLEGCGWEGQPLGKTEAHEGTWDERRPSMLAGTKEEQVERIKHGDTQGQGTEWDPGSRKE